MPVEIPLDKICVRTGVLCPRCQRLVDEGVYSDLDVRVMAALVGLERRLEGYRIRYVKSEVVGRKLIVMIESPGGIVPAWLGRAIQEALDDPSITGVVVIPYGGTLQKLVEYAVRPFRVVDTSIYYSLDGSEYLIVKLPERARGKLDPGLVDVVSRIAREKYGVRLMFEYVSVPEEEGAEKISVERLKSILDSIDRF